MEPEGSILCSHLESDASSLHLTTISLRFILMLFTYLHQGLLSGLFPLILSAKFLYACLILPMHAICPTHLTLDLITLIMFDEVYKL